MNKKTRWPDLILLVLVLAALAVSLGVWYNLGVYADVHNASMIGMLGGEVWLYLNALTPLLLVAVCGITVVRLFRK